MVLEYRLQLGFVIANKKIVSKYDETITKIMKRNLNTCELLLNYYLNYTI